MLKQTCPDCGGALVLSTGPGRFRQYRGEDGYEIPAAMVIPKCTQCSSLWLDSAMVRDLGRVFEAHRVVGV